MVLVNPGPEGARGGFHLIPQNLAAWPTSAKRVPPDGGYAWHACLRIVDADGREHRVRICASPGSSGRIWKGARASRPDRKNLRLPCRKDWLWLAKRALLSWTRPVEPRRET